MKDRLNHWIDEALLTIFRFRTRNFLRMEDAPGEIPRVPRDGTACLYLHVPFCESLCPFCSFHRVQHTTDQAQRYFQSLREEVRRYHEAGFRFKSAYFGGGTPTIEPRELVKTIELVRDLFGLREISVETNPKDLRPEVLLPLRAAGVTRLSVGAQSFDDRLLKDMERLETYGCAASAVEHIRYASALFPTVNVDLIFNQPHQDKASLERDLTAFLSTGANQVSFYPLMMSPMVAQRMAETTGLPRRTNLREYYQTILARLQPEFTPSSAWCFTRRSQGADEYLVDADNYVGVGSGAFSYLDGVLYSTTFCLATYQRMIDNGLTGIVVRSRLSESDQMRYSLLVKLFGLKLDRDWALKKYGQRFFRTVACELKTLEWFGAANRNQRGWRLTEHGMFWLVLMMSRFFERVAEYREAMRGHIQKELIQVSQQPLRGRIPVQRIEAPTHLVPTGTTLPASKV